MTSVASASTLSEDTSVQPVMFRAGGATLAGNLYHPAGATEADPLPGVVVTGTWTSVKEQMANRYAERLARHGLVALSFDFTGFGLSGGMPREVESPSVKTRDIGWAASFLSNHPLVHRGRVGALAICASAGYAASAAIGYDQIDALSLVAPWLHDAGILTQVYGGEDGVRARMEAGERARRLYVETGFVEYVPVVDPHDPRAAMPTQVDFYRDPARGAVPGWPNRFAVMAWTEWLRFDAIALAPKVTAPTLIVHSEEAAIPDGARRFYEALSCPKDILWTAGAQFDFYDREPQVGFAVERAAEHFGRHL